MLGIEDDASDGPENSIEENAVDENVEDDDNMYEAEEDSEPIGNAPDALIEKAQICGSTAALLDTAMNDIFSWFCDNYGHDMDRLIERGSSENEEGIPIYFDKPSSYLRSVYNQWIKDPWVDRYTKTKRKTLPAFKVESAKKAFRKFQRALFAAIVGYHQWLRNLAPGTSVNEIERPDFETLKKQGSKRTKKSVEDAMSVIEKSGVGNSVKTKEKELRVLQRENEKLKSHIVMMASSSEQVLDQLKRAVPNEQELGKVLSIINPYFNEFLEGIRDSIEGVLAGAEVAARKASEAAEEAKGAGDAAVRASLNAQAMAFQASSKNITTDVLPRIL
jgi:hypothetical protein